MSEHNWADLLAEIHMIADEQEQDIVILDGYDEAIIGYGQVLGEDQTRVTYSVPGIIKILMERDGMEEDEAVEFFHYNVLRLHVGPGAPMLLEQ